MLGVRQRGEPDLLMVSTAGGVDAAVEDGLQKLGGNGFVRVGAYAAPEENGADRFIHKGSLLHYPVMYLITMGMTLNRPM